MLNKIQQMDPILFDDSYFMKQAIQQAEMAYEKDEVPIGAVITYENRIIGRAHNQVEQLNDPTAHAEILAITAACNFAGYKHLDGCTIYITVEPCLMCFGAIQWARLSKIVYGAEEPKTGFDSKHQLQTIIPVIGGIESATCSALMKTFFQSKRN